MLHVAINGFGRIGRNFLRAYCLDQSARQSFVVKAINTGPYLGANIAHCFTYDSLLGTYTGDVYQEGSRLYINGVCIELLAQKDVSDIDWSVWNIDWVVDASGKFTHADKARLHIQSGAKHVLITAPSYAEDISIVPGVNMHEFHASKHIIVSLGSCTTNALMPLIKVVHETFGIENATMTTTHAYTNSQKLLDSESDDLRTARAAAINIIPTKTGADRMVGLFFPVLADHVRCISVRVPVAKVSLIDFTFLAQRPLLVDTLQSALEYAIAGELAGIMSMTYENLVSCDFYGNSSSVIIDAPLLSVKGQIGKVFGWYDNEWGYSVRLKDFLVWAAQHP